ncbi:MAG: TonB-dependent receptor domain-containing protein [Leadbetterella sp.]
MRRVLLSLIAFTFSHIIHAQTTISGTVVDSKERPLEFVNLFVYTKQDSVFILSDFTDANGKFKINIKSGEYYVLAQLIGYQKYKSASFIVEDKEIILPNVVLQNLEKQMDEVVITAKKPFLEQRLDMLVVNVASSPSSAGSSGLDILKKIPGLVVVNDRISIAGKNSVMILINGRSTQYTDINQVLSDLPANSIEKIEVIKNPSAKYDAAGSSVLNIVLSKDANLGTNGSININGRYGSFNNSITNTPTRDPFYGIYGTLSLNHRKGKINVYGTMSVGQRTSFQYVRLSRVIGDTIFRNTNYSPLFANSINPKLGFDYFISKKTTLGVLYTGYGRKGDSQIRGNTQIYGVQSDRLAREIQNQNADSLDRQNHNFNVNLKHSFDTTGKEINLDLDYVNYKLFNQSSIQNTENNKDNRVFQRLDNPVQFYTVKVDYTHPMSQKFKFETGFKLSYADIDNQLQFVENGKKDLARSNRFGYKENINAAYVSVLGTPTKKWEYQVGLRMEQTISKGRDSIQNKLVVDRNYAQLFPNIFVSYKFNKHLALTPSYTKRIDRPSYQQQNPFERQLDQFTFTRGNPFLRPQISREYKIQLSFDNQPFAAVGYNQTDDVIVGNAPEQDAITKKTFTTAQNLATYNNFFVEMNFPIKYKKIIDGFGGNQLVMNQYSANYLGEQFDVKRFNYIAYVNFNVNLPKKVGLEVNGFFMSRSQQEFLVLDKFGYLSFGVNRKFLDNKLKLNASFQDPFYFQQQTGVIKFQEIDIDYFSRENSRVVRLGLSYSFGNEKLKETRKRSTGSASEAKRIKE